MAVSFGKYELLRKIASGGMGQIFLARENGAGFERLVVLKLILPHLAEDEEFLTMFLEEARLVAGLQHPNLITILDLLEVEGRHCLAMEYVQGDDLRRLEKQTRLKGKPLPPGLALRIISEAAAGLDYAHKARDGHGQPLKLVHRDVSPQNILVGFDGGVKIIDFGVAKAAGSGQQTATGVLKGKYPYMSPEQASGQSVDGRSDQFALGVVMWELLTGKRLFKGESDLMTLRLVRDCQIPPPSQLNPKLPPGLDEVVLRALAPTPDKRYPDCGAFRLALEDYIIQLRLAASSAHLSAYLRELYSERIQKEADPSILDQLAEDTDLDARSTPSRSSARTAQPVVNPATPSRPSEPNSRPPTRSRRGGVDALIGPSPARPEGTRGTAPLDRLPSPGRRFPVLTVAVGSALVLLLAGAAVIFLRPPLSPLPTAPPDSQPVGNTPPEQPPLPVKPPSSQAPRVVEVELTSEPAGAEVQVDGKSQGVTPLKLPLVPEAAPVSVTLARDGYEPSTRQVSASNAPSLHVTLEQRRETASPPKSSGKKSPHTAPPLGIKTGR